MTMDATISSRMALDATALDGLKTQARQSPDKALRQAAAQFEAVFMNMLMKSMRETLAQDGPFDSQTTRMYTGMLDQQIAQKMSERGLGLADLMIKQLSGHAAPGVPAPANGAANNAGTLQNATTEAQQTGAPQSFVDRMLPHAREAERATGMPAQFILGQAALESGWGKREIQGADGTPSHNLFGIKAGRGWSGKTVDVLTTEYVDGKAQKVVEKFRAYDSYAESFADWARLIGDNPRYAKVMEAGTDAAQFAQGLQRAGYATDPAYAEKLTRVINHQLLKQAFG